MGCSLKDVLAHGDRAVVAVNGIVIPHDAISREAQNHPARTPIAAWTAAARALAVRELLLQEARSRGVQVEPLTDEEGRREAEEEALVRGLVETYVRTPAPDADACRRYYEHNAARFHSPDIFECAHILLAARRDKTDAFEAARERAEAIRALLVEAPSSFDDLAAAHSDCPSRAMGGNLGQVTPGVTTPEFERALLGLKVGEISPVVESRYGLHIIRLARRVPGNLLPFSAVQPKIETYLATRSRRIAIAQFIALLAARAELAGVELPTPGDLRVH